MKVDLIISSEHIKESQIQGKSVVVIDMLRATSVMVTALMNGCDKVIPVLSIEEAVDFIKGREDKFILGGERNALKIEGFHCSNSPLEYEKDFIKNKTLVMTTSNGTRAVKGCKGAKNILIGAMLNGKAVAKKLLELENDVVIVNAGTAGEFSIDDFICSGYIIHSLLRDYSYEKVELSDIAFTAKHIYEDNTNIISFIKYAKHYNTIINLGLQCDLEYCCQKDITDIVPTYINGEIK